MAEIAYRTWSLIPRDLDPAGQEPTLTHPPLMPNVALDAGASLHYDLGRRVPDLTLRLSVTALSAEERADGFLQVHAGEAGSLRQVEPEWSRSQDGPAAILRAHVGAAGPCVRLHLPAGATLVVTGIEFEG